MVVISVSVTGRAIKDHNAMMTSTSVSPPPLLVLTGGVSTQQAAIIVHAVLGTLEQTVRMMSMNAPLSKARVSTTPHAQTRLVDLNVCVTLGILEIYATPLSVRVS